ncbi:MAG: 1-phosphofructokinase family hexose kinase [Bacteroidales bacterium]
MKNILTLTMNTVIDKNTKAKLVVPEKKLRCKPPTYAPGGGGLNVSRAIKKLGGDSVACFLAGGDNRDKIASLLDKEEIRYHQIDSGTNVRENLMVLDETTGSLYRFGMPGAEIEEKHWKNVLTTIEDIRPKPDYLVASGSLPPGVPDDFYAQLAAFANKNDIRMVLDTSGPPLKMALKKGIYMIKPNLRELAELLEKDVLTVMEQEEAAKELLKNNSCKVLLLSLGAKGAMVAYNADVISYIVPPTMPVVSTVGAGDSMVAGTVLGLTNGLWPHHAARFGVAAGTAAAMTPGSELCRKEDTDKINDWLKPNEP